ncbi:MAG: hypothetical protein GTO40_25550, partial [Deltaproteobacteria bacterium]|nr:hypothetical protein [Deltaproteobacteria bacterium]
KYYQENGQPVFDHLNSDHLATFLYLLGNTAWSETGDERLPTKLFYLNKIMNGLDLYFSVAMPEVFLLVHPVGTVLGKAQYGNYLVVYQNCSVGAVTDVYPSLGEGVVLYSRSSVLGDCKIGDNVIVAANAFVLNTQVPDHQIVVGQYPDHRFTPNSKSVVSSLFGKDQ